ncbi:hypothetical protein UCDDS831_g02459 [Diplodia seriata]|uniref:Uncharacterized protein n=1 Tax=Diplodia seriata TaxID=420778 RepID=A0A0G2EQL2_9PEZI|nr:hypothetical protein UCDDS831_g02459 [Diplodia seriata]
MEAATPSAHSRRVTEADKPPLLRLNEDCLVHVAEAVADLDLKLKRARTASSDDLATKTNPGPLQAFSMVNKEIRQKTASVVFRHVCLNLKPHYQSNFERGLGVIQLHVGRDRFEKTIRWPRHVICHASYALYCRPQPLEHVEELGVCMGAEYLMHICPNTTTLSISETQRFDMSDWSTMDDQGMEVYRVECEEAFFRYASALTKLRSLQTGENTFPLRLSKFHASLPHLEHVHFGHDLIFLDHHPLSSRDLFWLIFGFPHLRTITLDSVSQYKRTLADGRKAFHGHYPIVTVPELMPLARKELAEDLLYCGHPTLEAVDMPVDFIHRSLPKDYFRFVKGAMAGTAVIEGRKHKYDTRHVHWKWHPAVLR